MPSPEVNDPDPGQTITYTATRQGGGALPGWLHFDGATRAFSGTPSRADVGAISIAVTATDNGIPPMAASATFTLTVEPPDVNSQALKLALASFGRTVASNAVDVLESRFTSPRSNGVMLGGQSLNHARRKKSHLWAVIRHRPIRRTEHQHPNVTRCVQRHRQYARTGHARRSAKHVWTGHTKRSVSL